MFPTNQTKKSIVTNKFKKFLAEYLKYGNLHPVQYIGRSKTRFETYFWTFILYASLAFAIYLSLLQLNTYNQNMVVRYTDSLGHPIWNEPFPAVTICNHNIVYKKNMGTFLELLYNKGHSIEDVDVFFKSISEIAVCSSCKDEGNNYNSQTFRTISSTLSSEGYALDDLMREVSQPCDSMLGKCFWKNKETPCNKLFKKIKSYDGYCCAFNYLGSEPNAWELVKNDTLFYSGGVGLSFGITVILLAESSEYVSNVEPGFTINIGPYYEFPNMKTVVQLAVNKGLSTAVSAIPTKSELEIKSINPKYRQCLFADEGNLKWNPMYSYQNCLSECKSFGIYDFCKCIPYKFPQNYLRTCSYLDVDCIRMYESMANGIVNDVFLKEDQEEFVFSNMHLGKRCTCFETCDDVDYLTYSDGYDAYKISGFENQSISILNVYWNGLMGARRLRKIKFTWNSLLASIGGIFGLCLGGSVVSIIELFYHFVCFIFNKNDLNTKSFKQTNKKH